MAERGAPRRAASDGADRLVDGPGGVTIVVPAWSVEDPALRAAVSTRTGGVSPPPFGMNTSFRVGDDEGAVRQNRKRFFAAAGVPAGAVASAAQVHGAEVAAVEAPGHTPGCDALVTSRPGLWLAVSVADCVPVLIVDRTRRVAAAVHSGWKGSVRRIAERCVGAMQERHSCRPGDLEAYVGPAAGACCYEVGEEVASLFPASVVTREGGRNPRLDLQAYNRDLLLESGLSPERVLVSGRCTIHEAGLFHSHRRDALRSGRMLAIVGFSA